MIRDREGMRVCPSYEGGGSNGVEQLEDNLRLDLSHKVDFISDQIFPSDPIGARWSSFHARTSQISRRRLRFSDTFKSATVMGCKG